MQEWQQRVEDEYLDLMEKVIQLRDFLDINEEDKIETVDLALLTEQYVVMSKYADILRRRMSRFK